MEKDALLLDEIVSCFRDQFLLLVPGDVFSLAFRDEKQRLHKNTGQSLSQTMCKEEFLKIRLKIAQAPGW